MIKIIINVVVLNSKIVILVDEAKIGIGINRTISMSKTIKIIANKKNRIENGIRALWLGSNPHSKAEDFSRFVIDRIDVTHAIVKTIIGKIIAISEDIINNVIN